MPAKVPNVAISMITLGVDDVQRSVKFYTSFGWEMSPDSDPAMCTFINTPLRCIEVRAARPHGKPLQGDAGVRREGDRDMP